MSSDNLGSVYFYQSCIFNFVSFAEVALNVCQGIARRNVSGLCWASGWKRCVCQSCDKWLVSFNGWCCKCRLVAFVMAEGCAGAQTPVVTLPVMCCTAWVAIPLLNIFTEMTISNKSGVLSCCQGCVSTLWATFHTVVRASCPYKERQRGQIEKPERNVGSALWTSPTSLLPGSLMRVTGFFMLRRKSLIGSLAVALHTAKQLGTKLSSY